MDLTLSLLRGVNKCPSILAEPQWGHEETEGSPHQANLQDQEWESAFHENLGQQEQISE